MKSKLTLSVTPQAVRKGKRIARLRKQSLSELVNLYLDSLELEPNALQAIDPQLEGCFGAYRLPPGKSLDDIRLKSLLQKHAGEH